MSCQGAKICLRRPQFLWVWEWCSGAGIARTVAARSIRQRASSLQTTAAVNPQIGRYRLLVNVLTQAMPYHL